MTKRMATAAAVLLALTACGGGGSSTPAQLPAPSSPKNPVTPQGGAAKLAFTLSIPKAPTSKSKKAHIKDITASVAQIDVMYANSGLSTDPATDHFFALTGAASPCTTTTTPGTFSCTVAVPAGSYPVQINTDDVNTAAVGVTLPTAPLTFTVGSATPASFTITPVVATVTSSTDSVRLPADGTAHAANITTTASDPDGATIVDPVVLGTVFGAIGIGSTDSTDVAFTPGQTSFSDPGATGSLATALSFTESEAATTFNSSFSITPSYAQGSAGTFTFFAGTGTTPSPVIAPFPASLLDANTFVATIAQSGPATGGTGSDDTYSGTTTASVTGDATQTLTFGSLDTFSGFTVTEFNAGDQHTGSLTTGTNGPSSISFTTTCSPAAVTITPATPTFTSHNGGLTSDLVQAFSITASVATAQCTATFFTMDWGSSSILTTLNIVP